jgi:N-acetylglucosamine kinase-like BadF-type ATPase
MYLGVDGGGTKTAFALISAQGQLLAAHQESGSYYVDIGIAGVERVLQAGVTTLLQQANCRADDIRFAFFGLPAYGEDSRVVRALDTIPARFLSPGKYRSGNDMVCGWAGSLGCQDGVNIVAGTGSISYGENAGRTARCGGWGELFGDEGSAYWIGQCGLKLFSRMSDGRSERGPLYEIFRTALAISSDLDLSGLVLNEWHSDRSKIAKLSVLVSQAAQAGDLQAREIFRRAASELVEIIEATCEKLEFSVDEKIPVSYSGGVFNAGALILDPLAEMLGATARHYQLAPPLYEPLIGAALYAAKCDGVIFSETTLANLKAQVVLS